MCLVRDDELKRAHDVTPVQWTEQKGKGGRRITLSIPTFGREAVPLFGTPF